MPKQYLNSFYPLCCNKFGRKSISKYNLPKYIDGSCRREPDFENELPCITGLCRPGFAEKLTKKDIIVYVTNKRGIGSRKIVAVLEVIKIFNDHRQAADWYIKENRPIPNNIMVEETSPMDLDKTHGKMGWDACTGQNKTLISWNNDYKERAERMRKVVQCSVLYKEFENPMILDESRFEKKLIAQNPPILSSEDWEIMKELVKF